MMLLPPLSGTVSMFGVPYRKPGNSGAGGVRQNLGYRSRNTHQVCDRSLHSVPAAISARLRARGISVRLIALYIQAEEPREEDFRRTAWTVRRDARPSNSMRYP